MSPREPEQRLVAGVVHKSMRQLVIRGQIDTQGAESLE
jgi:hypothetical protein